MFSCGERLRALGCALVILCGTGAGGAAQTMAQDVRQTPTGPSAADLFMGTRCAYLGVFAQQIARNHIRNVPFLRLRPFDYGSDRLSAELARIAGEIRSRNPMVLRAELDGIDDRYRMQCEQEALSDAP
jgi:hypothetical protein